MRQLYHIKLHQYGLLDAVSMRFSSSTIIVIDVIVCIILSMEPWTQSVRMIRLLPHQKPVVRNIVTINNMDIHAKPG